MIYNIGEAPKEYHHPSPRFVCMVRVAPKYKKTALDERILLIQREFGKWELPSGEVNEIPGHAIRSFLDKQLGFLPALESFDFHCHRCVTNGNGNYLYVLSRLTLEEKPKIRMGDDLYAHMWCTKEPFLDMKLIPGEELTLGDVYKPI